ncbi:hypothetical protein PtB15_7B96 [Puccinia triticina]|nr:hypothetical protein PtB15_7B96 [Puccinia triticina]
MCVTTTSCSTITRRSESTTLSTDFNAPDPGVEPPLSGPTEVPLDSPLKIRQNVVAIYQNIAGTSMSFAVLQQVMIANISALVFELKLNTKVSHSSPYT